VRQPTQQKGHASQPAAHQRREISTNNKTNCAFLIDAKNQHLPKVHYTVLGAGVENWHFHFWSGDFDLVARDEIGHFD
jgi:hypothetical protein